MTRNFKKLIKKIKYVKNNFDPIFQLIIFQMQQFRKLNHQKNTKKIAKI